MKDKDNIGCKAVLVGDTGVGKTSLIERYVNNRYEENQQSTLVSTYTFKKIDIKKYNKSVSLDIWDTAGQEVYRSLSKNFYLNASIGILVYDISRRDTFESIKDYWYEQLKTFGEENMIFDIVGNKSDLFENEEVKENEAREYAQSINAGFHLVSCKDGINIKELYEDCAKRYLEVNNLTGPGKTEQPKKEKIVLTTNKKPEKKNVVNRRIIL